MVSEFTEAELVELKAFDAAVDREANRRERGSSNEYHRNWYASLPPERKEIIRAKGREYYWKNRESISAKAKERYKNRTPEQVAHAKSKRKIWWENRTPEQAERCRAACRKHRDKKKKEEVKDAKCNHAE